MRKRRDQQRVVTIYNQLGYEDRYEYFTALEERFKVPVMTILLKAEKLGPEKDFTELIDWVVKVSKDVI